MVALVRTATKGTTPATTLATATYSQISANPTTPFTRAALEPPLRLAGVQQPLLPGRERIGNHAVKVNNFHNAKLWREMDRPYVYTG